MNLEEALTVVPAPAAIVERDTRRADEVREALRNLDKTGANIAFDQADLLAEAKKEAHWATHRAESIEEWFKGLGIDLSKREIFYRIRMSEVLNALGVSREKAVKAKITKLKMICQLDPYGSIVDPDTEIAEPLAPIIVRLIDSAPFKTAAEIKEEVNQLLGKAKDDDGEITWINWPIRRDAKEVVMQALQLAKALSGDTIDITDQSVKELSDAAAFERICASFLADPNNMPEELGESGDFEDSIADGEIYGEEIVDE